VGLSEDVGHCNNFFILVSVVRSNNFFIISEEISHKSWSKVEIVCDHFVDLILHNGGRFGESVLRC